ncbi:hypothetical protein ACF1BQ_040775 [Bradyrhizobium sp. RDT10]
MAFVAIADRREIAAALDQGGIERVWRRRIDRRNDRPPNNRKSRRQAGDQHDSDTAYDELRRPGHAHEFEFVVRPCSNTHIPASFARDGIDHRLLTPF